MDGAEGEAWGGERASASPPFVGEVKGLSGEMLVGWAYCPARPDERVVVEILSDDYPIASASANVFDANLRDRGIGDGCHGFVVALPPRTLASANRITVRVANCDAVLSGFAVPRAPRAGGPAPVQGEVHCAGGLRLTGWLWDPARPGHHVEIGVFEGGARVATARAGERRADLAAARIGSGDHGFTVWLPIRFADGRPHELRVIDEEGREVAGSPVVVIAGSSGVSALLGQAVERLAGALSPELEDLFALIGRQVRRYEQWMPHAAGFADYAAWCAAFQAPGRAGAGDLSSSGGARFVVLVHGKGDAAATLRSLQGQSHGPWRVAVVRDDDQGDPSWRAELALSGTLVVLVRAGDRLPGHALQRVAAAFADPAAAIVYTDCDQDAQDGSRSDPWFKPAWDPDLFLSQDYLLDLFAARAELFGARAPEAVADLPFLAVEAAQAQGKAIRHLPEVLCHRSAGTPPGQGSLAPDESLAALKRHLARVEPGSTAEPLPGRPWLRRVRRRPPASQPLVSIVIPTRDKVDLLSVCVSSLLERTSYRSFEIIIVDNNSRQPETADYLRGIAARGVRVLSYPHRFNYAAINNFAVEHARGSLLCLLNNDVEVITPDWLDEMVALLLRPGVGTVGAKLLWPNGMVQHGGVVVGVGGLAAHAFNHVGGEEPGYADRAVVTQRYTAVTAACLLCRTADYVAVGGLDAGAFPVAFNDVDFCLKLGARGLGVVWTPFAQLYHYESASRGAEDTPEKAARAAKEMAALRRRWAAILADDPCYSPNLNLDGMPFTGLALPPRAP